MIDHEKWRKHENMCEVMDIKNLHKQMGQKIICGGVTRLSYLTYRNKQKSK